MLLFANAAIYLLEVSAISFHKKLFIVRKIYLLTIVLTSFFGL